MGNTFTFLTNLSRHKAVHDVSSNVNCTCGANFTRFDNLKRHQLKCSGGNTKLDTSDYDESLNVPPMDNHVELEANKSR